VGRVEDLPLDLVHVQGRHEGFLVRREVVDSHWLVHTWRGHKLVVKEFGALEVCYGNDRVDVFVPQPLLRLLLRLLTTMELDQGLAVY
jgi:hypothetical protein